MENVEEKVIIELNMQDALKLRTVLFNRVQRSIDSQEAFISEGEPIPKWLKGDIEDVSRLCDVTEKSIDDFYIHEAGKAEKKPSVDRGKLLIGLECCRMDKCESCPYSLLKSISGHPECNQAAEDTLAYIGWLEEKLEGKVNAEGN